MLRGYCHFFVAATLTKWVCVAFKAQGKRVEMTIQQCCKKTRLNCWQDLFDVLAIMNFSNGKVKLMILTMSVALMILTIRMASTIEIMSLALMILNSAQLCFGQCNLFEATTAKMTMESLMRHWGAGLVTLMMRIATDKKATSSFLLEFLLSVQK